ncbi:MAG TPA: hypothetical protein VN030_14330 [Cellvibrio sp.]|nr:hypothetical protein [Cellvibrio sp.]
MSLNSFDLRFPGLAHPHAAVIRFFNELFRRFMTKSHEVLYGDLDVELTKMFDLFRKFPSINNPYESGYLTGFWYWDLQEDDGIHPFETGSRYLVKFLWDEDTLDEYLQRYEFPLVFYSPAEIQSWFVWAMNKCITFFPDHKQGLTELMHKHVDVEAALQLMQARLNGAELWQYGPAEFFENKRRFGWRGRRIWL